MFSIRDFEKSCALTSGMAERLGVDLPGAILRNPEIEAAAYRSAVLRCMGCRDQAACQALQAEHATLEAAPDYCRNEWG